MGRTAKQNGNGKREANGRWKSGVVPDGATPFPPGVSGNPNGRPNAGAAVADWYNQMEGWTLSQIAAVIADPESSNAKVAAAQQWQQARDGSGLSVDRICDRTAGRPKQSMEMQMTGEVEVTLNLGGHGDDEPSPN